jgi:Ca2+-binding EF-hand superfamily protein
VTFRRLIKLSYGSTFIKEGDRDLEFSELVRLIHVANAFECMDAVKECATALTNLDLGWEGAVQCLELTDMLKGVEGMADLAKKAGDVVAEELGPVHELLVPVKDDEDGEDGVDVLGGLRLSEKVKVGTPNLEYSCKHTTCIS